MARKPRQSEQRKNDALADYRAKRDFDKTAEPSGDATPLRSGHLFVVQKHAASHLHYDFRLELDGVLKSWAVPKGPSLDPTVKALAVQTEDHPIEYGDFEGVIPKGEYGGGTVMLWDRGHWQPIGDPYRGIEKGDLKFRLHGAKLAGEWALVRMKPRPGERDRNWLLIKKKDAAARSVADYTVLSDAPDSIATGRTLEEIAADRDNVWKDGHAIGRQIAPVTETHPSDSHLDIAALPGARARPHPHDFKPQLATSSDVVPPGDEWLHEIKLDGYRLIAHVHGGSVRLCTRNGHDWTSRFQNVARALGHVAIDDAILDGEVVVLDRKGISDFGALQAALGRGDRTGFVYEVFDLPHAGGFSLAKTPLLDRKRCLATILETSPDLAPAVRYCDHIIGKGEQVLAEARKAGLEGIVSKRINAAYEQRRAHSWLKVKNRLRDEFVIGGFTAPKGSRSGFGSIAVGRYDPETGALIYQGRVGSGFDDRTLDALHATLLKRRISDTPFTQLPAEPELRSATWTRPELVAEVEYTAISPDGFLRHPVFIALREDKAPTEVTLARDTVSRPVRPAPRLVRLGKTPADASVAGVRISNPERAVYPIAGLTKLGVAEYYAAIADHILPHIVERPLSLVRCPDGVNGQRFYQRHVAPGFPEAIDGVDVPGEERPVVTIRDLEGLISLIQFGVLEIHPWGCRTDRIDRPDRLIIDLDPGPGIRWQDICASALVIRDVLTSFDLQSFCKTSGGAGMHLVIPVARRISWEDAKTFTHAIARRLSRMAPRNFTATQTKSAREGRIYIDFLRNQLGATAVGAWSTRARDEATVSMPLGWEDVAANINPLTLNARTVPDRVTAWTCDPWEGFFDVKQHVSAAMLRSVRDDP